MGGLSLWSRLRALHQVLKCGSSCAIKEEFKQTTCQSQLRLSTERFYQLRFGSGFNSFEV
ncbi:mCG1049476 [Mus musculus]|nr:mCG1049476 [Mus musculus]